MKKYQIILFILLLYSIVFQFYTGSDQVDKTSHILKSPEQTLSLYDSHRISNKDTVANNKKTNSKSVIDNNDQEHRINTAKEEVERGSGLVYADNDGDGFFETVYSKTDKKRKSAVVTPRSEHYLTDDDGDGLPDKKYKSYGKYYIKENDTYNVNDSTVDVSNLITREKSENGRHARRSPHYLTDNNGDGLPD